MSNHEYYFDRHASLRQLFTLGLYTPESARVRRPPHLPPSAGWFESESFDPDRWKPKYPNRAFSNMRDDDAFWGARLVSRFSNEAIRAIVEEAGYDDPAVDYLTETLIRRRDIVARVWLNRVNPIVDVRLSSDGTLAFTNAAVAANVATHGTYTIAWSRFDNDSGASDDIAVERQTAPRGRAPAALLENAAYIEAKIWSEHPDRPQWAQPVRVYFRRDGAEWTTVGLYRDIDSTGEPQSNTETRKHRNTETRNHSKLTASVIP
jgi:hypothetical protein